MLGSPCGGCNYHSFPYKAVSPVLIDGKRQEKTFKSKEDVWDIIDLIVQETKEVNEEQGKDFDIANSVISQLPFFGCPNILMDKSILRDIERYIYCEKFGVKPFKGSYGDQPYKWVATSFLIKTALAKKEKRDIDAARSRNNTN